MNREAMLEILRTKYGIKAISKSEYTDGARYGASFVLNLDDDLTNILWKNPEWKVLEYTPVEAGYYVTREEWIGEEDIEAYMAKKMADAFSSENPEYYLNVLDTSNLK